MNNNQWVLTLVGGVRYPGSSQPGKETTTMSDGLVRKAIEAEAKHYRFPEEHDYRSGIRAGGGVIERMLRSDDTVKTVADKIRCTCAPDAWALRDCPLHGEIEYTIRAILAALTEQANDE